jgi:hypothetical protein
MEYWWDDTDRVKPKFLKKNLSQCNFVHHEPNTDWPGMNPSLRGKMLATDLSHSTNAILLSPQSA